MDFEEVYELMTMPLGLLFEAVAHSCNDDQKCQIGVLELIAEHIDRHIESLHPIG